MKLDFYSHLVSSLTKNKLLTNFGWNTNFYRLSKDKWFKDLSKTLEDNAEIIKTLNIIKKEKKSKKIDSFQFFYIDNINLVIRVEIPARTLGKKLLEFTNQIHEAIEYAELSYFATHDHLTRILNRAGSEKEIAKLLHSSTTTSDSGQDTPSNNELCGVITFDIDHFKQVNDSYGHIYGDVVLKAFASRLETEIDKLKNESKCNFVFSRPGGEEFEVFVNKLVSLKQLGEFAERLRACIELKELPSEKEFEFSVQGLDIDLEKCPKLKSRAITTSVGYSSGPFNNKIYSELKSQSDAALYRAKSDGRNCCRNFSEIKIRHGKVLEHVVTENIVIIDIGRDVSVSINDVFKVYSPDFAGKKPYLFNDNRSIKELGIFPKISTASIQVIDVQASIAFCTVIENFHKEIIIKGSSIEYEIVGLDRPIFNCVPPPTIGHLLRPEEFWELVNTHYLKKELACIGIARINLDDKDDDKNIYLDILLSMLKVNLPQGYKFGYMHKGGISFFADINNYNKETTTEVLNKLSQYKHDGFNVSFGALLSNSSEETEELLAPPDITGLFKSSQKLDIKDILHLVRICSFMAARKESGIYSEKILDSFLYRLRNVNGFYDEGIYEYQRLIGMGFDKQTLHMQGALLIFGSKNDDFLPSAATVLEKLLVISDGYYLKLNLAIVKTKLAQYLEAYNLFKTVANKLLAEETNSIYLCYYAKSAIEVSKNKVKIAVNRKKNIIERALRYYKANDYIPLDWISELKSEHSILVES